MKACIFGTLFAVLVIGGPIAKAGIPEPDLVLYGQVFFEGVLQTKADTNVSIIARVDGVTNPVGSYTMGKNAGAGDSYVLRIRLESLADGAIQSNDAALIGQTVHIIIKKDTTEKPARDFVVPGRGHVQNILLDTLPFCGIASANPPHCAIDAGYTGVDGSRSRWNAVEVTFACSVASLHNLDFTVSTSGNAAPTITSVTNDGSLTATLNLSGPIEPGAWTCFTHSSGAETCFGFLPGDVNADQTSGPGDILEVINNLNGDLVPLLEFWQCDIDRSGKCGAADILGVIDLLNGAIKFEPWINVSLPTLLACPVTNP